MIELLSPAGGIDQIKAAIRFGADAVYAGMQEYGLRAFAGNFSLDTLPEAVELVHDAGKRFYLTLNIMPFDEEIEGLVDCAASAQRIGVDAVIVSDIGAMIALRRNGVEIPLHISTQANTLNTPAAEFYFSLGAKRIILSRELSLSRISAMRERLPQEMELEAFIYGAACMSYSGRCLLSNYLTGRSSNHGACSQPCRWNYVVEKEKHPDEQMPVFEDSRGTYIFSAQDLNMLGYLPEMMRAGISSFKIEGRMKTEYYVATVTHVFRTALELLSRSEAAYHSMLPFLQEELRKASHRDSNTGFYFGNPLPCAGADGCLQDMEYIARIEGMSGGEALLSVKNRFFVGDTLEVMTPQGVHTLKVLKIVLCDTCEEVDYITIAGTLVRVPVSFSVSKGDFVRGINRNHRRVKANDKHDI